MNILFIHETDWIKNVVFSIHTLAEAMSLRGHNVYAIDYESMWERDGLGTLKTMEYPKISRALAGSAVTLIRPGFIKVPVLSRASAFATHFNAIKQTIKEKNIDAIILYSAPTNGLQAVYWAKKFGIPVIFRSIDALYQLVHYPLLRSATKMFEKLVYSRVDKILTITPKLSEYVVSLGAKPENVEVLPITVDTKIFYPNGNVSDYRQKWGIGEKDKVILFIGTLYNFSGLDSLIHKMPSVLADIPDTKLLIVGDGQQRRYLENIIESLGLWGKVIITGFQPYDDVPRYINLADICINPFANNDVTKDIFPGKVVQYLACGKPLVSTPLPGLRSMIDGERQGVVYTQNMSESVKELLENEKRRRILGCNGLSYARQIHSCESISGRLESIIEEIRR